MQWVGARLRSAGFAAETFGYHSIVGGPDEAVPRMAEQLRGGGETDIVAHSISGLVALQALAAEPGLPVPRVVCRDRKSTRLNYSHSFEPRRPSSACKKKN